MAYNTNTDETQLTIRAASFLLYKFKETVNVTMLNFFAQYATEENLERLGRDQNAPRYKNESFDEYRDRIINVFDFNRGIGKAEDIIRAMVSLGYVFNSYTQGDTTEGAGSFNLLVHTLGGVDYDASEVYDANIKYNAANVNDINIELIQAGSTTTQQEEDIRNILNPIIRASSIVLSIVNIVP